MGTATPSTGLPGEVRTVRVLLFIIAGITALTVAGGVVAFGPLDAEEWGRMTYVALPGVLALVLGLGAAKGGGVRFWLILGLAGFMLLVALARLADNPLMTLVGLLLPGLVVYFVTRPRAREHFRSR